jgi:hypothetical protein
VAQGVGAEFKPQSGKKKKKKKKELARQRWGREYLSEGIAYAKVLRSELSGEHKKTNEEWRKEEEYFLMKSEISVGIKN